MQKQREELETGYTALYDKLRSDLDDLTDKVNAIKSCDCTGIPAQAELPDFLTSSTTIDELADALLETGKFTGSGNNSSSVTKEDVQKWIAAAIADKDFATKADVSAAKDEANEALKNALTSYLWVLDYEEQIKDLDSALNKSKKLAEEAKTAANDAATKAAQAAADASTANGTATEAQKKAVEALTLANALNGQVAQMAADNTVLSANVEDLLKRVAALESNGGSNGDNSNITGCSCPSWLPDSITSVAVLAHKASTTASEALEEAQKLNDKTKAYVDSVVAAALANKNDCDNVGGGNVNVDLSGYYDKTQIDSIVNANKPNLDGYYNKTEIDNLLNGYATTGSLSIYATKSEVEAKFNSAYTEFKDSIGALRTDISDLIGKYDIILGMYDKLVTGVSVEATTNSVLGSLIVPGYSSTVLAAYYGTMADGVEFPTVRSKYFANGDDVENYFGGITLSSQLTKSKGETVVQQPGDIYLTVNPNDVDYSGINLSLVNSQGVEAPGFSIGALQETNKVLTFGYTRASSNGFYVSHASIDDVASVEKISIDKSSLKSSATSVLSQLKSGNYFSSAKSLATVAATLLKSVNNTLPAYAVKATWNDGVKDRSVTSRYSIAATAVPALSYKFGQGVSANVSLPRVPSVQTILNNFNLDFSDLNFDIDFSKMFGEDSIVISVPLNMIFDIEIDTKDVVPDVDVKINTDSVKVVATITGSPTLNEGAITAEIYDKEAADGTVTQDVKITVAADAINMDSVGVKVTSLSGIQVTPTVTIPMDKLKITLNSADAVDDSKSQFVLDKSVDVVIRTDMLKQILDADKLSESVNSMLNDKLSFLTDITSSLDGTSFDTYINQINSLLSKIETFLNKDPNSYLQPVLLCNNGSSLAQVSAMRQLPTTISLSGGEASAVLYGTSYTAEIIAPAYKKYVEVYKLNGSGNWEPYATGNNAAYGTGTVVDGDRVKFGFHATETGLYRVVYQALDYAGKVAGRSYYIQVK
jgi:hypothetical protein